MLAILSLLQSRFEEHLRNKTIPDNLQWQYKKWLRYYLDYCVKYHCSPFPEFPLQRKLNRRPSSDIGNVIFLNASDCNKRDRTITDCVIQIFEADGLANVFLVKPL